MGRSNRRNDRRRAAVDHRKFRVHEQQARSLRSTRCLNPRTLRPGDIVRARVTFEEGGGYAARPVLVCETARHGRTRGTPVCTRPL